MKKQLYLGIYNFFRNIGLRDHLNYKSLININNDVRYELLDQISRVLFNNRFIYNGSNNPVDNK